MPELLFLTRLPTSHRRSCYCYCCHCYSSSDFPRVGGGVAIADIAIAAPAGNRPGTQVGKPAVTGIVRVCPDRIPLRKSVSMSAPTCRLVTLGCKVNQYETQLVKETLLKNGFREAADDERADLCVVNTCTVTETGDAKSRQLIRRLARRNPGTRTIVMGCYATRDPAAVAGLPSVSEVVTDKRELPDVFDRLGLSDLPSGISHFDGRQRAYVKVQDGCILKCTFCI